MSTRAIRLSITLLAATVSVPAGGQSPFSLPAPSRGVRPLPAPQQQLQPPAERSVRSIQTGTVQHSTQRRFKPVPREGFHRPSQPTAQVRQTGWDLKWRRSTRVQTGSAAALPATAEQPATAESQVGESAAVTVAAGERSAVSQSQSQGAAQSQRAGQSQGAVTRHPAHAANTPASTSIVSNSTSTASQQVPAAANPLRQVGHHRDVFGRGESQRRGSRLQTATQPPDLVAVTPAAYNELRSKNQPVLNAPRVAQRAVQPTGAPSSPSRSNFFADPFGEDPKLAQTETAPPPSKNQPGEQGLLPPPVEVPAPSVETSAEQNEPSEPSSGDGFALPQEDNSTFPLPAPVESKPNSDATQPKPTAPKQSRPQPQQNGGSLRDMLENNRPDLPRSSPGNRSADKPQDGPSAIEEIDREQPFRDRQTGPDSASDRPSGYSDLPSGTRGIADYSCEDFRQRIAAQTIDLVSLDISPPFRPDEFSEERFERLKAEFEERQPIRKWRDLSGEVIAEGRLQDLAYEKAVIETEQGEVRRLPVERLSEGDIGYITESWGLPKECLIEQVAYTPRKWSNMVMTWKASNICHTPLYFQDVNLERYGHTHGPLAEPLVQTAHFFGSIIVLPYKMGVHSPHECVYPLGYYRPGNCAPWITPAIPISAKGAINQAATMTGMFWLIP